MPDITIAKTWYKESTDLSEWFHVFSLGVISEQYEVTITCGLCDCRSTSDCNEYQTWAKCKACGAINKRPD